MSDVRCGHAEPIISRTTRRAVRHKHVGYVLAAARQDGEQASRTEIVGKMLHKRPPGQVAVTANHQLLHPVQPGAESLETFGRSLAAPLGTLMTYG